MDDVRAYLLSVCGAALLSAVANRFLDHKGGAGGIGKIIIGVYLVLVVLQPISSFDLNALKIWDLQIEEDGKNAVLQGEENTHRAICENIKRQTAAYIVQKAETIGVTIAVEVSVSDDSVPKPDKVYLTGSASPYARQQLMRLIEQEIGIPKENQIWT